MNKRMLLKLYLWTLSYFKPYIPMTILYVLFGGVMIWGELMIPRRMGYIIDHVIPLNSISILLSQIIFLILITLLILISKSIFKFFEFNISNRIIKNQQTELMLKLQALGFSYYEKVPTGQILSLFENSVKEIQQTYTFLFPHFIYSMAQFVVPSLILIMGEPIFFFASMVGNIIYVSINRSANKKIHHYLGMETEAAKKSQQSLYDVISSMKEMKAMGRQDWLIEQTIEDFDDYRKPRMKSIFWRHFRFTTVGLTLTISMILFYYYGMDLIRSGELLLGEFIGYSFLMGLASRGFSVFFYIVPAQYHALNYAKDIYEFLYLEPDVKENLFSYSKALSNYDIEFNNVSFAYDHQNVVEDLSLKIPYGKKVAIVGESGCGKSTLLKLIGRFYDVNEGSISLGNQVIDSFKLNELRSHLGYVFQDTYLFNTSILENIRFGRCDATDDEVIEASKLAGAHEFILETDEGYATILGERGSRLSGGQKQRLSIARTFLLNPKIILLDEATSALDTATEVLVKESIDNLSKGKTVIAVAHRLSTIKDYDVIVVLEAGKIVEQGTFDDLMALQSKFYGLVMRGVDNEK